MKNSCVTVLATLLGLSLPAAAGAESLKSKLADVLALSVGDSQAASEAEPLTAPAVDEAERQVLDAEARDAATQALESARGEQE